MARARIQHDPHVAPHDRVRTGIGTPGPGADTAAAALGGDAGDTDRPAEIARRPDASEGGRHAA